jgi:hypothetical protein
MISSQPAISSAACHNLINFQQVIFCGPDLLVARYFGTLLEAKYPGSGLFPAAWLFKLKLKPGFGSPDWFHQKSWSIENRYG